ncbi:hypothetical protein CP960_07600 [Malaciobacter halophilus]|uniref:Acyloxyacyl hydrolase n=1 Tax=Malaciobacter halophilus TaxID=197482 RepID=A0A2N1J2S3_9BACT|nr:acyloxyacyl hydrolase [Malaciobacter halophilus]AXH09815.1 acyloxyacyl hydrolase [Malaciobacter halophilus]PKI80859.1 hypothetical protein CP960_07600 [Malaciobacter halophilus]
MKKLLIALMLSTCTLFSFDKVSIGYSTTSYDSNIYDLSLITDTNYKLFSLPVSLELAFDYIDSTNNSDELFISSFQPVITYDFNKYFFIQGALGFAYLSDKSFEDRKFGTNFQFKQSVIFGYNINKHLSTTLRYNHISNADLDDNNSGLDIFGLNLIYKF